MPHCFKPGPSNRVFFLLTANAYPHLHVKYQPCHNFTNIRCKFSGKFHQPYSTHQCWPHTKHVDECWNPVLVWSMRMIIDWLQLMKSHQKIPPPHYSCRCVQQLPDAFYRWRLRHRQRVFQLLPDQRHSVLQVCKQQQSPANIISKCDVSTELLFYLFTTQNDVIFRKRRIKLIKKRYKVICKLY